MNRFIQEQKQRHPALRLLTQAVIFGCGVTILMKGVSSVSHTAQESQAESLRKAIIRSAVNCYATEGVYPESLAYLKDHYGISWNPESFFVDYEITGSNLMPGVTVISLKQ